jgi:hypothetical protein
MRVSGWTLFSAVMLIMAGTFAVFDGFVAVFQDEVYLVTEDQLIAFDFTTWGWIHIIIGVIVFAAGLAVAGGAAWGRAVGAAAAFTHAVVSLGFITAYPLWTILIIAIDIIIIYGLLVPPELESSETV